MFQKCVEKYELMDKISKLRAKIDNWNIAYRSCLNLYTDFVYFLIATLFPGKLRCFELCWPCKIDNVAVHSEIVFKINKNILEINIRKFYEKFKTKILCALSKKWDIFLQMN